MTRATPLAIEIRTGDPRPISRQIVEAVRMMVAKGDILPGMRVPSVRGLAQQLVINPNTVAKAYQQLAVEGWLEPRSGLGLFVAAPGERLSLEERERRVRTAVDQLVQALIATGWPLEDAVAMLRQDMAFVADQKRA